MKIGAAVFDLDGTLINSLIVWGKLWESFGEKYMGDKSFTPDKEVDADYEIAVREGIITKEEIDLGLERLKKVIEKVGHKKLVLAHLGGSMLIDEVTEELAGLDVYMDTANDLKFVTKDKFLKLISKHGEDKILFATDMPWSSMKGDIEIVKNFVQDSEVLDKVFYKNALSLLSL